MLCKKNDMSKFCSANFDNPFDDKCLSSVKGIFLFMSTKK